MRIQIASDLHLEHLEWRFPKYRGVEPTDADVLVLAGDIANGARALELFGEWPCPVIYVPGNHEYYGSSLATVQAELAEKAQYFPNITILAPGITEMCGVRFIGSTLWTDYCLFGEQHLELAMVACAATLPDHKVIKVDGDIPFSPAIAREIHLQQKEWLRSKLNEPFKGKTVVVTHHAPAPASLHPMFEKDLVSTAFISDLTDMLGSAALHIHGHTHHSFDYDVRGTRVIANPMGYSKGAKIVSSPSELRRENANFNPQLVVEL
ncbi:MAG: metallophosphoesterase [Nitrosomonas ureae]